MRLGLGGAGLVVVGGAAACVPPARPTVPFPQGIAAGLHNSDAVVIWTRVEPEVVDADVARWVVSSTPDMASVVASGSEALSADRDHTVKVLIEGLDPDRSYWYRFEAGGATSATGRARTLPAPGADSARLAVAFGSCQSFANGFYGAWRDVASRDVDAVVHLGDYIYESPAIQLLSNVRPEQLVESVDLETYRSRYRQYKGDPDLQAAHAAHPWAMVWDDHEIYNDWDRTTLIRDARRAADAMRAWFEYQPVWPVDGTRIHRSLQWGSLAGLHLLDSRQYRDEGVDTLLGLGVLTDAIADERRTMLGVEQRSWLLDGLSADQEDGVTWKLVGSPQPMGPMRLVDLDTPELRRLDPDLVEHAGIYSTLAGWDGFPAERDLILAHLADRSIDGVTVLSGDVHSFWSGRIRADFDDRSSPVVARDHCGGSISSSPGSLTPALLGDADPSTHDWDFIDGTRNGYGILECTPDSSTVTMMGLDARYRGAMPRPIYSATETH